MALDSDVGLRVEVLRIEERMNIYMKKAIRKEE
jgi:hypothetical protein